MKSSLQLAIFSLVTVLLASCAVGPPDMLTHAKAPIPRDQVSFWLKPAWPAHYVKMARLDASFLGWGNSPRLNCHILKRFQKQAAKIGANAVLLEDPVFEGIYGGGESGDTAANGGFAGFATGGYSSPGNYTSTGSFGVGMTGLPVYRAYAVFVSGKSSPQRKAFLLTTQACDHLVR